MSESAEAPAPIVRRFGFVTYEASFAAMRAARTPPEPAPMVIRSKS